MAEPRNRAGFPAESFGSIRTLVARVGAQDLERDGAIQASVARAIDLAHAAGAERGEDFVGTEAGAGGQRHRSAVSVEPWALTVRKVRTKLPIRI